MSRSLSMGCLTLSVSILAGCYVPPEGGGERTAEPQQQQEDQPPQQRQQTAPPGWGQRGSSREIQRLAREARQAFDAGNYSTAVERLESALEQQPDHPVLLQQLAAVNYAQGTYQRAERMAMRAIRLGGNDVDVLRESWWLVAAARMQLGDSQGARSAARVAERLEGSDQQFRYPDMQNPGLPSGSP